MNPLMRLEITICEERIKSIEDLEKALSDSTCNNQFKAELGRVLCRQKNMQYDTLILIQQLGVGE